MASRDTVLADPPAEGISALTWASPSSVAAAGWDCTVRLYVPSANDGARAVYRHKAPVLDVCAGPSAGTVVSGGVDMDVRL